MSHSDDLDMALDGYEPDNGYYSRPASRRNAAPASPKDEPEDGKPEPARSGRRRKAAERTIESEVAPAEATREATAEQRTPGIVRFIMDERLRLFVGCALLFISVFIIVALVSHFRNAELDQSYVQNLSQSEIAQNPQQVHNAGGGFGAWISKALFCDALGLGSLAFIVYSWILALAVLGFKKCNFWSVTFKTLIVAITTSIVLGLVTYHTPSVIKWGGTHGRFVNEFLINHTTALGAILVSAFLLVTVACVYLEELTTLWQKWCLARERRRLQAEMRREREEKARNLAEVAEAAEPVENAAAEPAEQTAAQPVAIDIDSEPQLAQSSRVLETIEDDNQNNELELEDMPADIDIDTAEPVQAAQAQPDDDFLIDQPGTQEADAEDIAISIDGNHPVAQTQPEADPLDIDIEGDDAAEATEQAADAQPMGSNEVDTVQAESKPEVVVHEGEGDFSVKALAIEEADMAAMDAQADAEDEARSQGLFDHKAELPRYVLPGVELLEDRKVEAVIDMEEQQENKERIVKTLSSFGITISKIEATVGPTVTLYEIVPAEGVRISQIKRLEDDIALSLAALGIRIIAPIPGKPTVGIEVPNSNPQTVSMCSVIKSKKYQETKMMLPMALGATIKNEIFVADLAKMPHLLVAGATGQGKSVGLNVIITSLLYKKHPSEIKFVLVDPKMVEFSLYSKLERHYLAKLPGEDEAIITDSKKVVQTLNSLCIEMDQRYALLKNASVRALEEYNEKFTQRKLSPADGHRYLPYLVVIVDEFADLIMVAGKEVEAPIMRIAQKARAVGIHMIIATQRPSTNVITGPIKANFPGRMAFRTIQMVDSKTILDTPGANQLIGKGDMLFSINGSMERVQCAFVSTPEVERITSWIDNQVGYEHAYYLPEYVPEGEEGTFAGPGADKDSLFDDAARFVVARQVGSTSMLQRQFNIGYNRAGRLMDQMEAAGIVGPVNGSKPRAILMDMIMLDNMLSAQ